MKILKFRHGKRDGEPTSPRASRAIVSAVLAQSGRQLVSRGRSSLRSQIGTSNCSTLIGITGTGISPFCPGPTPSTPAQRQLASRGRACASAAVVNASSIGCSTPIGITGTGIASAAVVKCRHPRLLNANWHHGDGHTATRTMREGQGSPAQRQLASRGRASDEAAETPESTGNPAQRQLASRGRAFAPWAPIFTGMNCSTPIGITGTVILNIFSTPPQIISAQLQLASRGRSWRASDHGTMSRLVLNSNWHHGDGHAFAWWAWA